MKIHTPAVVALAAATALVPAVQYLQANSDPTSATPPKKGADNADLPEMVVTATREPRAVDTVASNATVITAAQISASNAQTVADVLRSEVGLQVADQLGNGKFSGVDLRGFGPGNSSSTNTLVLVDGRRLNDNDGAGVDWTAIPLERIERIEVVRGGNSVMYGDKAVAGVIQIFTKKGSTKNLVISDTSFGSFRTYKQTLGISGATGPLTYAWNGGYSESKGHRENNSYRNKTSGLSLGYDNGSPFSLYGSFGMKEDDYGLPGQSGATRYSAATPNAYGGTQSNYLQLVPKITFSENCRLEIGLQHSETEFYFIYPTFVGRWQMQEFGVNPKLSFSHSIFGLENEVTTGIDFLRTKRIPKGGDYRKGDIIRTEVGFYVNDTLQLIPKTLYWDMGYRYSYLNYDYVANTGPDQKYRPQSFRTGLTWVYAPKSKVFASWDKSLRSMLLSETFTEVLPVILPPQTSRQAQIGVQHHFNKYLTAGVTGFQIDTTNEIFYNPITFVNTNYPSTRRQGVELSLESDPFESLHVYTNYTYMNSKLRDGSFVGNRIPLVAQHRYQAGVTWSPLTTLEMDVRAILVKGRYGDADWNNTLRHWDGSDYKTVDTKVTWKPLEFLKVYAGVNNVFNEQYSEYGGVGFAGGYYYAAPKRNYITGVTITKTF